MFEEVKLNEIPPYIPDEKTREFILRAYTNFASDKLLKEQSYRHLGNTTLQKFWQICQDNYNVIVPLKAKNDWKRSAKRTITRDGANGFIAKLVRRYISPEIFAQNKLQEIDLTASRIFRILLEYWERKARAVRVFCDAVHTCVIEGTVHVQQLVINGREEREIAPNSEIYVPNFKQSDIQKQSHLIRAHITSYEEAKMIYGDNENWKFVRPGTSNNWGITEDLFNDYNSGIENDNEVLIIYLWEHTGWYKDGKSKPKKSNVLIDGVPMFDIENVQSLKHNLFPMSRTVFEHFADVNWYWGNSLPGKVRQDQSFLDTWRTLILNKGILNFGMPLFNKGGEHVDDDVIVPFKITPTQSEPGDIFRIEGIGDPVTANDVNIEKLLEDSVHEGTASPVALGNEGQGGKTLGEIQLQASKSNEVMEIFGKMIAFLVEDMAEQSLANICQFEIKKNINKLVDGNELLFQKPFDIPNQRLTSGDMGTMSLRFTPQEQQPTPMEIAQQEFNAKKAGTPTEIVHIDPEWFSNLDTLIYVSANPIEKPSRLMESLTAIERYKSVYFNNPNIDQKEATRIVIEANGDDETRLLAKDMPMPEQQLGQGSMTPPTQRMKSSLTPKPQVAPQMV